MSSSLDPQITTPKRDMEVRAMIESGKQRMREIDSYLMDLENSVLEHKWQSAQPGDFFWTKSFPKGRTRCYHPEWAELMKTELDGAITFDIYKAWCEGGGGDDCFVQDNPPDNTTSLLG